jgi:predicted NBD/HSP70 family sugar kinase
VLNGSPYGGASGLAGEIGHTQVSGDAGPWCRCGNRGCHETLVSASFVHDLLRDHPMSVQDGAFPLRDAADHPAIARFVTEAGRTLGRALADVCNRLNPSGIVLGGQLGTADAPLVDGVRKAIQRYSQPSTAEGVHVKSTTLGLRSELMGAVAVAILEAGYHAGAVGAGEHVHGQSLRVVQG